MHRAGGLGGAQLGVFAGGCLGGTALSLMVFFALCAQCASTLVIIGKETRSWLWPIVTFSYMTALAWLAAFATYQLGTALGW